MDPHCPVSLVSRWECTGKEDLVRLVCELGTRLTSLTILWNMDWDSSAEPEPIVDPKGVKLWKCDLRQLEPHGLEYLNIAAEYRLSINSFFVESFHLSLQHLYLRNVSLYWSESLEARLDPLGLFKKLRTLSIIDPGKIDALGTALEAVCNVEEVTLVNTALDNLVNAVEASASKTDPESTRYPWLRRTTLANCTSTVLVLLDVLKPQQGILNITCDTTLTHQPRNAAEAQADAQSAVPHIMQAVSRIANGQ